MGSSRKRRDAKANGDADCVELRGFRCDLSTCDFADIIRERAPWFAALFEAGLRKPKRENLEWDFRGVKTAEDAREAVFYEYGRETEWLYCYHAEWLAALTLTKDSEQARRAVAVWKQTWCPRDDGCPDPFFEHVWMMGVFPMPWANVRPEDRACVIQTGYGVHTLSPADFAERITWKKWHYRAHAIEVDWSLPPTQLEKALARWAKENRPADVALRRSKRGKRIEQPFQQLKWLAASRLAACGMSYKAALQLLPTNQVGSRVLGAEDPHSVLPVFASQGAWATAVGKARGLIRTAFPDPRAG